MRSLNPIINPRREPPEASRVSSPSRRRHRRLEGLPNSTTSGSGFGRPEPSVTDAPKRFPRSVREAEEAIDGVRHRHERDPRIFADEAGVGTSLRRRVNHLRRVIAGTTARQGKGRNQPGETNGPEVYAARPFPRNLPVMARDASPEVLARQLGAAVHRKGLQPFVLADLAHLAFDRNIRPAVDRDRAGEEEPDRLAAGPGGRDGQLEQVHRALYVDLLCHLGDELGLSRKDRGQVKDDRDVGLSPQRVEQTAIKDIADPCCDAAARQLPGDWLQVEGDDVKRAERGQLMNEAVPYLATGSCHERELTRHARSPSRSVLASKDAESRSLHETPVSRLRDDWIGENGQRPRYPAP